MKVCWQSVKMFVWYPILVSDAFDCSVEEAVEMIVMGRVAIGGVVIKDADLGLGAGAHTFTLDKGESQTRSIAAAAKIQSLNIGGLGSHMAELVRSGEKVAVGRAVVQKHGQTLSVCYHEVLPEERGYDLVGFNGNGAMLTGCMANI